MEYRAKDYIYSAADTKGVSTERICTETGVMKQSLSRMLNNDVIKFKLFQEIVEDILGYEIVLKDRETGKFLKVEKITSKIGRRPKIQTTVKGRGRVVIAVRNGVEYDTRKADAIANSFFADGEHEYKDGFAQELYKAKNGQYFVVTYSDHVGDKDVLQLVDDTMANIFMQAYKK